MGEAGGLSGAPARMITPRFALITASGLAYFVGWTMLYPVLPRFVREELGGNGLAVGLAVGSFGLSAALLRPMVGRFGDRRGRRPLVVVGMAIVAASLLGYLVTGDVATAVVLRLAFGAGEAAAFVGLATAIQDMAPAARRGEAASYFSVATYGGVAIGPPLGQFIFDHGGYDRVWLVASATVLVGLVFGLAVPGDPPPARVAGPAADADLEVAADGAPPAPREAPDDGRLADAVDQVERPPRRPFLHPASLRPGIAVAAALVGYSGFVSFVSIYMEDQGLGNPGVVFSTYAVLIVAFRILAAKVPDRYGAVRVSSLSVVCLAGGLLVVAAWPTLTGLLVGVVFFAFGMALNFPALLALVVGQASDEDRTWAVASFSVFFDIGFGAGGPIVGAIVALTSVRAGFVGGAMVTLASLLFLRSVSASLAGTVPTGTAPADEPRPGQAAAGRGLRSGT
jgi:MFS family permease